MAYHPLEKGEGDVSHVYTHMWLRSNVPCVGIHTWVVVPDIATRGHPRTNQDHTTRISRDHKLDGHYGSPPTTVAKSPPTGRLPGLSRPQGCPWPAPPPARGTEGLRPHLFVPLGPSMPWGQHCAPPPTVYILYIHRCVVTFIAYPPDSCTFPNLDGRLPP